MTSAFDLRSLARALGGEIVGGEVLAPGPGHSPRDRSLSVKVSASSPDNFMAHSFAGDDWRECRDYVRERLGLRRETERRREPAKREPDPDDVVRRERTRTYIADLVAELRPIRGTPGESYLHEARRIETRSIADVLRHVDAIGWHPGVRFNQDGHELHGRRLGCIVAIMTDAETAKRTGGISRTYVYKGEKIGKAKGLGPAGVVRLSPDDEVTGGLHIAEGLETALAAMPVGLRPMWSAGSTSILSKMPVVSGIEAITILADHDANGAGERAARELQERWTEAGREARLWIPRTRGDLNDILMGRSR